MNLTHNGKIGRLPKAVQEELNRRMDSGEKGPALATWLNSLPEVQAVLAEEFEGRPVNLPNLCGWRKRGYAEWLRRREALAMAMEAGKWEVEGAPPLTDQMASWASVRYLMAVRKLAEENGDGEAVLKVLSEFCHDIVALRRGECSEARLKLELERLEFERAKASGKGRGDGTCPVRGTQSLDAWLELPAKGEVT